MGWLFLILALLLNASANILLKLGSARIGELKGSSLTEMIVKLLANYQLILGLFLFASNVVFYFIALSKLNLSVAYPIMVTGGFFLITIFSVFYLKETLTIIQITGIVLIAIGITLLASNIA